MTFATRRGTLMMSSMRGAHTRSGTILPPWIEIC
nr:MAG TPA: hypothetical protein [Caudoviricetes sp.]DAZ47950.1 MAG TPA: hypothetical protein [Caudoviricetes sp.]